MKHIFLFILLLLPLFALAQKELTYIVDEKCSLYDVYPTGKEPYRRSIVKGFKSVFPQEVLYVMAYDTKRQVLFVYNDSHMGYIHCSNPKLYKIYRKKAIDIAKPKNNQRFLEHKDLCAHRIDAFYIKLEEERVAEEQRRLEEQRMQDSINNIKLRDEFVKDSIKHRENYVRDSLEWIKKNEGYHRLLSEIYTARVQRIKAKSPVAINIDSWDVDDMGGVTASVSVVNCSSSTIKYISFRFTFKNPVGDVCRDRYTGKKEWTIRGVGPIKSYDNVDCIATYDFNEPSFFSRMIEEIVLSGVTIQYMNGKIVNISGNGVKKHLTWEYDWENTPSCPIYMSEEEFEVLSNCLTEFPKYEPLLFNGADVMPQFPMDVNSWLAQHLIYPAAAAENGIQGRVVVNFIVEKDGSISEVKIVRSIDPALDREAVRVVKDMPKWKPGLRYGNPVRVLYTLPITFKLT